MFILDDQESAKLSDIIHDIGQILVSRMLTVAQFKNIRMRTNHVLSVIWQEEIGKNYIHDGKFEQFSDQERSVIFGIKFPTLTNFVDFKAKIEILKLNHPVKEKMIEVLLDMQRIVDMVESVSDIGRIPK